MGMQGQPSTGYTYRGSCAQAICFGPVTILHQILNGTEPIWTGPVMRQDAADGDGKTTLTTSIGTIIFYWGTATQNPNALLQSLVINQGDGPFTAPMPAYRKLCYAVLSNCSFGSQTTPPTLNFVLSRFPEALDLDGRVTRVRIASGGTGYSASFAVTFTGGGGTGAAGTATAVGGVIQSVAMTSGGTGYTSDPTPVFTAGGGTGAAGQAYRFHELDGDCLLPEFSYEVMTDTFWGAGADINVADLNTESFVDACEQLIIEDIGASPNFDEVQSVREIVGKLRPYMDSVEYMKHGQLHTKLIRKVDLSGVPTLTEADFTDEPLPKNEGFDDTANFFRLNFTDRDNNWEDGVEPYDNPAHADIVSQSINSDIPLPFITRRKVAKEVVKRIGLKQSKPALFYEVRLQPTHSDKNPGDVIKLTYAKLGFADRPCRIMEIERSQPDEPEIVAVLMVEHTRTTTFDYVPPDDFFFASPTIDETGSADFAVVSVAPRVQILPPGLKGSSLDGFLVAFNRSDLLLRYAKVHWTWDEVQKEYTQIGFMSQFPHAAQLVCWHKLSATNWFMRLRFPNVDFRNAFNGAAPTAPEWIFVAGYRKVRQAGTPSNDHQLMGLWGMKVESGYFQIVDTDLHDIEVTGVLYGADPLKLETIADPANNPTEVIYFGARPDFFVFPTDSIAFERNLPNSPVNPATGLSPDTGLERLFKVTAANHRNEQAVSDVSAVEFDRNDTTMNPNGTYVPDWGARAPTSYEFFDVVAGQYLLLSTADAYPDIDDFDEGLGNIYDGAGTDSQKLVLNPIDDVLGAYLSLANGIYTNTP